MDARTSNGEMEGGSKAMIKPHRFEGVFVATKGKQAILFTKNMVPHASNERFIFYQDEDGKKVEYRAWNHRSSKLAAAILVGVENIWIKPGARVLCLGKGSGKTVSHVSDIVGPNGVVYAVESSRILALDLVDLADKRGNVIPIIEDARHPEKYTTRVGEVDVICSELADPDQSRILALNERHFLKAGGHFVMLIDLCLTRSAYMANCMDSTLSMDEVMEQEGDELRAEQFNPKMDISLSPFHPGHGCEVGAYREWNAS